MTVAIDNACRVCQRYYAGGLLPRRIFARKPKQTVPYEIRAACCLNIPDVSRTPLEWWGWFGTATTGAFTP